MGTIPLNTNAFEFEILRGVNKMKRISIVITSAVLIFVSTAYNFQHKKEFKDNTVYVASLGKVEPKVESNDKNLKYNIMNSHVRPVKYYKNIEELNSDSRIIIEGVVKSTESVYFNHLITTVSQVELYEVYKTNDSAVKKGETICIKETGGMLDKESLYKIYKDKFPDEEFDKEKFMPQKVVSNGIRTMEQGDHIIIFASKPAQDKCYYVAGVYQGKYLVYNDRVEHQVPSEEEARFKNKVKTKEELINLMNKN